jgi:hypothetical protein
MCKKVSLVACASGEEQKKKRMMMMMERPANRFIYNNIHSFSYSYYLAIIILLLL